ncbi:copper resistance CopC family protein [Microbacterium suaedae]|uniref:copper resistance CopC family protein n=1 Tax=Microbacterium suaedae TaxID=2067813 RepID=UPI0013A66407|nr:copper resistance CopC family protein [Microbacterium suaedae]
MKHRDSPHSHPRAARALVAALVAGAALLAPFAVAAPAAAHSSLVSTTPETDGTVAALPAEVSLTFSDDLTEPLPEDQQAGGRSNTQVQVYDASCEDAGLLIADPGHADTRDCTDYASGNAVVDGPTVTQALDNANAPAGVYTVVWQVVYGDGHADSQMFTFTAESAAATPSPEPTSTPDPTSSPAPSEVPSAPTETDAPDASAPPADSGLGTPAIIAIVGGIVVLALIAFIVTMIVRARRP